MTRKLACAFFGILPLIGLAACGGGGSNTGKNTGPLTVSPHLAGVAASVQSQTFTATLADNLSAGGVTWTVDTIAGGNSTVGVISSTGVYTAPATAGTHTITATSTTDASQSDSATIAVTDLAGVFTYHNNLARDGTNTQEYLLSGTTVSQSSFGRLFTCSVDGAVYTQPLWVPGVSINGVLHNVIYVATQHDSLYAFDADANPCVQLWKVSLLDTFHGGSSGETSVPCDETKSCVVGAGYGDIQPEIGVTGSPVIDPTTSTIYLVSKSWRSSSQTFYQRLHALDLVTGMTEKFSGPTTIAASVAGSGDGGSSVTFSPQMEHQRSGLALANGTVYITWAAHEDATPYHGWVIGYNASNLSQSPSVFNTTPNGGLGGIWMGGGAPAVDATGDVYVVTGNGIFDELPLPALNDYGDSIIRLHPFTGATSNGVNLSVGGWFTPDDQETLTENDTDLGSGSTVLLPDQTSGPTHLLAQLGKEGVVYLVDRDNMGQFRSSDNSQIVQSFIGSPMNHGVWGTPAFWQNTLYFGGQGEPIQAFTFEAGSATPFTTTPSSQSATGFNYPGATPSISSQGSTNGIVWAIDASLYGPPANSGAAVLHAYNAANLGQEYWNSSQASNNRDEAGNAVKFVPPTVANGKVYVSTRSEIDVYGFLP